MSRRISVLLFAVTATVCTHQQAQSQDRVFGALKPISSVTASIRASEGPLPERTLVSTNRKAPDRYIGMTYCWRGTNVSYSPLVFEDYNLERHGHNFGCMQPAASAVHFATSVASMPYKALFCYDRDYELGHIRPGNCAPFVVLQDGRKLGAAGTAVALITVL